MLPTRPAETPHRRGRPRVRNEILRAGMLGGIPATTLAHEFGTPFYAYDLDVIGRQVERLQRVLPSRFDLAYTVKANPSVTLARHLGSFGIGVGVGSRGELSVVRRAGIPGHLVNVTGAAKSDDLLSEAVRDGVWAISVEAPDEIARIAAIATATRRRANVVFRVMAQWPGPRTGVFGDVLLEKFGLDRPELDAAVRLATSAPQLHVRGVHVHVGGNILDVEFLADHARRAVELAVEIMRRHDIQFDVVNIGGSLGVQLEYQGDELDIGRLGALYAQLDERWDTEPRLRGVRIRLEPGRFLVGSSGAYVARVLQTKSPRGEVIAIVDGGMNHFLRPALMGQDHRVQLIRQPAGDPRTLVPVAIAGPVASPLDVLARGVPLPRPRQGDLVCVLDAGAYGFTEAMHGFNLHPGAAEIAIHRQTARLIRARESEHHWVDRELVPDWDD